MTEEAAPAAKPVEAEATATDATGEMAANDANGDETGGEPRRGWWQRTFGN